MKMPDSVRRSFDFCALTDMLLRHIQKRKTGQVRIPVITKKVFRLKIKLTFRCGFMD